MSEAAAALAGDNGSAGDAGAADTGAQNPGAQPWMQGYSEENVAFIQNKGWVGDEGVNTQAMLDSYQNLEKLAGGSKNVVALPGEDADEATINNFYNALGRPESADKYSFEMPDGGDADLDGWFRQAAHKHGLSDRQAAQLYAEYNEMAGGRVEAMLQNAKEQAEMDIKDLQKEWGGKYDDQIASGRRAANALGFDEARLSALEAKMGTGEMLKLFADLGTKMGEDSFVDGGRDGDSSFGVTPAAAAQQIADLKLDQTFMGKYLAGDKDAVAKMTRLTGIAYG